MPPQQLPNQQLPEWPVDLDRPPQVVRLGEGRHGTGALVEDWLLPDLWALHFYRYDAELEIGGTATAVHPGYVSVVAPGVLMRYRFRGPSEHAYAHLRMRPGGQRIGALHQLRGDAGFVRSCWADALSAGVGDEQRRDAAFWAALWRLARSARPDHRRAGLPPAVSTAVRTIEDNLDRPLPVAELAAAAGVSHNHLTRLFGSHLGTTVVGYVRRRRLEEAEHLLRNSTMPVARIARMVGIPDLQAFNKACRREFGQAPRALRDTDRGDGPQGG